jgi:hypothetical protein
LGFKDAGLKAIPLPFFVEPMKAKSVYAAGTRSGTWIKIKLLHEQELIGR